jgi:hypothetical protein
MNSPSFETDYRDFELSIWAENGRYYAKVIDSPAGQSQRVPLTSLVETPQAAEVLRLKLENALLRSAAAVRGPRSPAETTLREFGQAVFDSVFRQAEPIADHYTRSLAIIEAQAPETPGGLRVKLRIDAPELAQLPWEYLYNSGKDEWLGLQHRSPIIRFLDVARPPQEITVNGPLNVLGMIADPGGEWERIDAERERRRIDEALQPLQARGQVNFCWVPGQTPAHLVSMMSKMPWHVFHFIGHGGGHPPGSEHGDAPEGFIVMADEQGRPVEIAASDLKVYLQGPYGQPPRLVVLNCCEGAREVGEQLTSPAAALVRWCVPSVVAMQFAISDVAAVKFAEAFYERLVDNAPIEAALTHARIMIQLASRVEWGIPVLYTRSRSGRLFGGTGSRITPAPSVPAILAAPPVDGTSKARIRLQQLFNA